MSDLGLIDVQKEKRTNTILIILGVLVGIVAGISVAGLVIAIKNKEETSPDSDKYLEYIDMNNWRMNEGDGVYYQIGLLYCKKPVSDYFQRLAIFVPVEYMDCKQNGIKYSCKVKPDGKKGDYTAKTAPISFQVETPGYSPCPAMTSYPVFGELSSAYISEFSAEGIIVMVPGLRGSFHGAPLGIVDLKAAVAYLRHQKDKIPGDKESFFSEGHSGGGAQSCLMGVSGDNEIIRKYMDAIGAENEKDHILGSYCWCPITNLDTAGEAYEWNLGWARDEFWTRYYEFSAPMAKAYSEYINGLNLTIDGTALKLEKTDDGYFQKGTYYDYVKKTIEHSFENFVDDTNFTELEYEDVYEYLRDLNNETHVMDYDNTTKKATLDSIANFALVCKFPTKGVGAFDTPNLESPENRLFGVEGVSGHFDLKQGEIFQQGDRYKRDMARIDFLGYNVTQRVHMYTPLNYLHPSYEGYNKSTIAKYFRIRTGLFQPDISIASEVNLVIALKNKNVTVDYESVWEQVHDKAERKGTVSENLIGWIKECMKKGH